jgi:hypothetical protein
VWRCFHTARRCCGERAAATMATMLRRLLLVCALTLTLAPCAFADGDPPSDVLVGQDVYYGWGLDLRGKAPAQLPAMLATARERGFELKVALISGYSDLGEVGTFWQKPAEYVRYLGDELSLVYHGRLLVLMRNGYGIYDDGNVPGKDRRVLSRLGRPGKTTHFFSSAIEAVQQIAAANGVKLAVPDVTPPKGGVSNTPSQHAPVPTPSTAVEQPPSSSAPIPATASRPTGSSSSWLFLVPVGLFVIAAAVAISVSRRRTGGVS